MFEKKIASEILRCIAVENPDNLDVERFIQRFAIDKLGLSRKLLLYVSLPAFRNFLSIKLDGVLDAKEN